MSQPTEHDKPNESRLIPNCTCDELYPDDSCPIHTPPPAAAPEGRKPPVENEITGLAAKFVQHVGPSYDEIVADLSRLVSHVRLKARLLGVLDGYTDGQKLPRAEAQPAAAPEGPQTFAGFAQMNLTRCESQSGFNHKLSSWSTSDWFLATIGELGEAANVAKKLNRVRDGIPGNKESESELRDKLRRELGDVFVYLDLLAQSLGFNIGAAAMEVFNAKSKQIGYEGRPHRIGVFDYQSLCDCLKHNLEQAMPDYLYRDPQDAIQTLAARVMTLQREKKP